MTMTAPASLHYLASANNGCQTGVTFRQALTCYDDAAGTDLSDFTGLSGRVRITDGATTIWEGATGTGEVTINVATATLSFTIPAATTETFTAGMYHIDIDVIDTAANPDEVDRLAHGDFEVSN
jgi:hypothetical protein